MESQKLRDLMKPSIGQQKVTCNNDEFCVKILRSSNENVINLQGEIFSPAHYEIISLGVSVFEKQNNCSYDCDLDILVPAKVNTGNSINRSVDYCKLRYGIFMHWVDMENDVQSGSFGGQCNMTKKNRALGIRDYVELCDVNEICDELQQFGFEFFQLTDFHGLGVTSHPSAAVDYWRGAGRFTAKRDLVRELIDALKERGMYLALFTHPLDGHDFSKEQQELLGWNDPTDNYRRWNDFINDVYGDLASRYGNDIICMGFDSEFGQSTDLNWTNKLDLIRLRNTIATYAPNLPLVSLSPSNDLTGYSLKEAWRPSWIDPWMARGNHSSDYEGEYDVEDWPAYYRPIAVVITKHWTTITPRDEQVLYLTPEQMFRYTVLQISTSLEGPGIMWGNSCYIDGGWESGVKEALSQVNEYIEPIRESLKNVYPSTSYFTKEGTKLKELPHGICATKSADDRYEYIHVMNPPESNKLVLPLPADKKSFEKAICMEGGQELELLCDEHLTIIFPENFVWNTLCTTVKLTVTPETVKKRSKAFHKTVFYSTSEVSDNLANCDFTACRLVDGLTEYVVKKEEWATNIGGWKSKKSDKNPYVGVDLHQVATVEKVILYPTSQGYDLPVDFDVMVSSDGENYDTVVRNKNMEVYNGKTEINFPAVEARYIKIQSVRKRGTQFGLSELEIY